MGDFAKILMCCCANPLCFLTIGGVRRPLLIAECGVAQGCPLSETIWALVFDPFIRGISLELHQLRRGFTSACADDLGAILRGLRDLQRLLPHLLAAENVAGLQLQPKKRVTVPTWSLPTPSLTVGIQNILESIHAPWRNFTIALSAKYLGFK
eukprot:9218308-Pyramimonas_sp.AAC.1